MEVEKRRATKQDRKLARKISRVFYGVRNDVVVDTLFNALLAAIEIVGKCTTAEAATRLRDSAEKTRAFIEMQEAAHAGQ